jgi:hypothetical protein
MKLASLGLLAGLGFLWTIAAQANGRTAHGSPADAAPVLIDFPETGSIFPPDIAPPTFLAGIQRGGDRVADRSSL